eukprot:10635141-Prorocentrum_lima.AAC.1
MRGKSDVDGHRLVLPEERDRGPPRVEFVYMFLKSDGARQEEPSEANAWAKTLTGVDLTTRA